VNDKKKVIAAAAGGFVVLALAAFVMFSHHKAPEAEPVAEAPARPVKPAPKTAVPATPPPAPAIPLPELGQSDSFIREKAKALSSDPKLASWLKSENIVRRIAAAADMVSSGRVPSDSLGALAPRKGFTTTTKGDKVVISAKSYARYDAVAAAVDSLDVKGAATLFQQTKPLFQQACQELGDKSCDFQDTFVRAASEILETPIVDGDLEVQEKESKLAYTFVDPKLEQLSQVQKQMLRMGPANVKKIQTKLRDIAGAIGVPNEQLPKPEAAPAPAPPPPSSPAPVQ